MSELLSVTELLSRIVRIPSVNPTTQRPDDDPAIFGELKLARWLAEYLSMAGFDVELQYAHAERPNLIASWYGDHPRDTPAVCLCSHLDVVPVGGMTVPPFDATISNGKLYGRGSADPKGSVASMIVAALTETAKGSDTTPPVILLFNCDEETGFSGARYFVNSGHAPIRGAVIGEPTGCRLVTGHKGIYRTHITTTGISAHAAMPEDGVSAIYRMAPVLRALEELAESYASRAGHPTLGPPSLNAGTINGGVAVNSVPDRCSVTIDRRTLPGESAEQITLELEAAIANTMSVEFVEIDTPFQFTPGFETPDGQWLSAVVDALGQEPGYTAPFATDGAVLQQSGIDCVVFGPGEMEAAHTRDEHIHLAQLDVAVDAYRKIIQQFQS